MRPLRGCTLALSLLLALSSAGCYTTRHQRLEPNASLGGATGITTRAGDQIQFAKPGATITNDTLFAIGTIGPLKVPTDSVADVTSRGYSSGSSFVVIGAAAAAVLTLLFLDLASSHGGT
jgi:hypothetical protein